MRRVTRVINVKSRWPVSHHVYLVSGCREPYVVNTFRFSWFNLTIEKQFVTRRGRLVNVVTFWDEKFIPFNCKEVSDPCYSVFWEYWLWEVVNEATVVIWVKELIKRGNKQLRHPETLNQSLSRALALCRSFSFKEIAEVDH
ncbi:hypothetical protein CUMW_110620 [Citrus unshiu]|nr:hypothetical protein CUMW_110620 [Citrus unshiu]GAY48306.1 hypothetical protein CUMW_110620 [Citrus unshiu]GAY48307.1 hypothetical protein CUMW_110620 [Citrus unshiu]